MYVRERIDKQYTTSVTITRLVANIIIHDVRLVLPGTVDLHDLTVTKQLLFFSKEFRVSEVSA